MWLIVVPFVDTLTQSSVRPRPCHRSAFRCTAISSRAQRWRAASFSEEAIEDGVGHRWIAVDLVAPSYVHQPSSQSGTAPGRRRRGKVIGAPVRVRM